MYSGKSSRARGCSSRSAPGVANAGTTSSTLRRSRSLFVSRSFVPSLEGRHEHLEVLVVGKVLLGCLELAVHVDDQLDLVRPQILDHVHVCLGQPCVDRVALVSQLLDVRSRLLRWHGSSLWSPRGPILTGCGVVSKGGGCSQFREPSAGPAGRDEIALLLVERERLLEVRAAVLGTTGGDIDLRQVDEGIRVVVEHVRFPRESH